MKVTCKLLIIIILYSFYRRSKRLFEEYEEEYDGEIYEEFLNNNIIFNLENY